ncbi:MAG TPA: hypothetical protein DEP71_07565 [Porphyromonadaceae bacterium]|nr:hypothetical protein [Porphyromonadaceae bacterium]
MKIRIGNDFMFAWEIERNGLPEYLSSVLEKHLYLSVLGKRVELLEGVDYDITGNVVRIEVTPTIANIIGSYNLELTYTLSDVTLSDADRRCAVDVDAFQIVARTAQADDPSEFTITSDMAIAFRGKSAYEVWLETHAGTVADYEAWIKQPALEAAGVANGAAELANSKAGLANTAAQTANTAAGFADAARLSIQADLALKLESVTYSETEYNEI